uniref:Uncharacterized protein n=1 Tax=Tetraodon nigroviridis TaxID=99883 RepID=H3BWD8_TETNG
MTSTDPFQFQEFEEDSLLATDGDVTISIEDNVKAGKQKSADDFTAADEGDNPLSSDDKTELLSGQKKSTPFDIEYYQNFDIETHHV